MLNRIWTLVMSAIFLTAYVVTDHKHVAYLFAIVLVVIADSTDRILEEMRRYNLMNCEKFARIQRQIAGKP